MRYMDIDIVDKNTNDIYKDMEEDFEIKSDT